MRTIILALAVAGLLPAGACEQPTCRPIFEDTFQDSDGGWDFEGAKIMKVSPSGLAIAPNGRLSGQPMLNLTFAATVGAYCMEVVLPKSPVPDNSSGAGITFWAADYEHRDIFMLYAKPLAILFNRTEGKFYQIFREENPRGFNAAEGAVNKLCVFAGDGKLAIALNDTLLKVVRAPTPTSPLRFGIEGGFEKPLENAPEIKVKSFRVLSAGKP